MTHEEIKDAVIDQFLHFYLSLSSIEGNKMLNTIYVSCMLQNQPEERQISVMNLFRVLKPMLEVRFEDAEDRVDFLINTFLKDD
jgi:hypothetical protein